MSLQNIQKPVDIEWTPLGNGPKISLQARLTAAGGHQFTASILPEQDLTLFKHFLITIRKDQHIDHAAQNNVEGTHKFTGFSEVHFIPEALPTIDWDETDTTAQFLGNTFTAPIMITGMTGGTEKTAVINHNLAYAAEKLTIPMGVGSQRAGFQDDAAAKSFQVKKHYPKVYLIGNLGFAQLLGEDALEVCQRAVEMIDADALAIHLNVLQECIQPEGDRKFKGFMTTLEKICGKLSVPIIVKEIGCGINPNTGKNLIEAGVSAIDVGGRGGTSWSLIEGQRSLSPHINALGEEFRDWGIPTAFALRAMSTTNLNIPLIATGGIRNGSTVAKACALGASMVGIGLPLLKAALVSKEAVEETLLQYVKGLRITMIATGSRSLAELSQHITVGIPYNFSRENR